ncbi:MAG TPA: hypothetical protein VH372_12080 [Actinospica sp.]|jgi:hypothetical protein|nr:hypothetical protein [Actinospica sp.]
MLIRRGESEGATVAKDRRPGFMSTLRETFAGGAAFGGARSLVPEGRAERLGLRESPPNEQIAPNLPFEFLRLGREREFGTELAGRPEGFAVVVFEFTAKDDAVALTGRAGGAPAAATYPYHVAAIEIDALLPWFALAQQHVAQPAHLLYPTHEPRALVTDDRRTDREYALYTEDPVAAAIVGGPGWRDWLPIVFGRPIESRTPVALEVSAGWALCALQARGMAVPDAVALERHRRLGVPGPWPDALLQILAELRAMVRA